MASLNFDPEWMKEPEDDSLDLSRAESEGMVEREIGTLTLGPLRVDDLKQALAAAEERQKSLDEMWLKIDKALEQLVGKPRRVFGEGL